MIISVFWKSSLSKMWEKRYFDRLMWPIGLGILTEIVSIELQLVKKKEKRKKNWKSNWESTLSESILSSWTRTVDTWMNRFFYIIYKLGEKYTKFKNHNLDSNLSKIYTLTLRNRDGSYFFCLAPHIRLLYWRGYYMLIFAIWVSHYSKSLSQVV